MGTNFGGRHRRALITTALTALALLASAATAATASAAPTGTIAPDTTFDFGNRQAGGGALTQAFVVTNSGAVGADPLVIGATTITGAAQYTVSANTCAAKKVYPVGTPTPLPTGGVTTCTVTVSFNPATGIDGVLNSTLNVATDGPTFTVALTGAARKLTPSATAIDLGVRRVGTTSTSKTFTIKNEGTSSYTLGAVSLSNAQFTKTADTCTSKVMTVNATCSLTVTFTPSSPGVKTATVAIEKFGPSTALGLTLSGEGEPQSSVSVSPSTHAFGVQRLEAGATATQKITVTNSGGAPLDVRDVRLVGDDAAEFALPSAADECTAETLAPNQSCDVAVRFDPSSVGWKSALVRISTDAFVSRHHVRVTGRGKGAADDPTFTDPLDLSATPIARLVGDGGDTLGSQFSSGDCDVNGDGNSDVLTGVSLWSRTPASNSWEGGAYIYPGRADVGSADLARHDAEGSLLIEGEKAKSQTGAVGCADVNGDGIDDILMGAWAYEYDGRPTGTGASRGVAYVVFGTTTIFEDGTIDLGHLGDGGFRIESPNQSATYGNADQYDHLGYAITNAGDVTGDGKDDIAVMANTGDSLDTTPVRSNNGIVWLVAGQSGTQTVNVGDPAQVLATIHGASPGSTVAPFGQMNAFASAGDVNGDHVPDLAIGEYTAVAFGRSTASGAAYVVSGTTRGRVDLADPASSIYAAGGAYAGHRFGIGISAAGDVNGDGLADVIVGADPTSAANTAAAYVIYGAKAADRPAGTLLDTATLGTAGYRIAGPTGSHSGFSVDGIGDANGDGHDDLVIGGYNNAGPAGAGAGSAWIVYGVADPTTLPAGQPNLVPANAADTTRYQLLADLGDSAGTRIDGQTAGERLGRQVAAVGDIDGNGAGDVAFGSDFAARLGRSNSGEMSIALLPGKPVADRAPDPPIIVDPPQPDPPAADVAPANLTAPSVSGAAKVGSTLTCSPGTWKGAPAPETTIAWLREGAPVAAGPTYVTRTADIGSLVTCRVAAANRAGTAGAVNAGNGVRVVQPDTSTSTGRVGQAGSAVVTVSKTASISRKTGKVSLGTVRCVRDGAGSCSVTARLYLRIGGKSYSAVARQGVAQGKSARLTVTLSASGRKALKKATPKQGAVTVSVTDAQGRGGSRTSPIALKRASR